MEPNFDKSPAPNTTAPGSFDQAPYDNGLNTIQKSVEKAATQETPHVTQGQPTAPMTPSATSTDVTQQQTVLPMPPAQSPSAVASQPDNEFNDEEVVRKARALIERTKTDPYTQSKEVDKMRVEYINKRFGRKIKSDKE